MYFMFLWRLPIKCVHEMSQFHHRQHEIAYLLGLLSTYKHYILTGLSSQ